MIGRVLSDRYEIRSTVGSGGMAIVYKAWDLKKKRTVAIKVLRPDYEKDEEFVRRFCREAEAASKVSHENIADLLAVGIDGEHRFLVMEYVEGRTLKEVIKEEGRIEPHRAVAMAIRILAALNHAHRHGIVHRDIKPQNIIVDKAGVVKVADFGIAHMKNRDSVFVDASAVGSAHYLSPEQAKGEVADEKSDLYSVGIVLYEMLTGRVPFDGDDIESIALMHVKEEPKSMRVYAGDISVALDEVVGRALRKNKNQRYHTAADMASDLKKALKHPRGGFVRLPAEKAEPAAVTETDEKKDELTREQRRLRRRALTAAVLVGICIVVTVAWFIISYSGQKVVPSVLGMQESAARTVVEASGLQVAVESVYSEEYEAGVVIAQTPESSKRTAKNTIVTLTVSNGTQWFYMEDVLGMTEAEAVQSVADSGALIVTVNYVHNDADPGTVVSQNLEEGWQSRDTEVVLEVSGHTVVMPSLWGLSLEGAIALLEAEGLQVGNVAEGYSADAPAHSVIEQSIAADTTVLVGTAIDLVVSPRSAENYSPAAPLTVVVPLDDLSVEITYAEENGQEETAFLETMNAGNHEIVLSDDEPGMHTIRVYIDGVLMDTTQLMFD